MNVNLHHSFLGQVPEPNFQHSSGDDIKYKFRKRNVTAGFNMSHMAKHCKEMYELLFSDIVES